MKDKPRASLDGEMLAYFYRMRVIVGEPLLVKSGKEATVYRCEGHPDTGLEFMAAKFYRPRVVRSFKNDGIYREGREVGRERVERAVKKKSCYGRKVEFELWVGAEYDTLRLLHGAGLDVPKPVSYSDDVILMEYVGGENGPAPLLHTVELAPGEARDLFDRVRWNIGAMLDCHRIHGDLSAYNILYQDGQVRLIDFPQAVDPRVNSHARDLLWRDVDNVCRHFADFGVHTDAGRIAADLWRRYSRARLYTYG